MQNITCGGKGGVYMNGLEELQKLLDKEKMAPVGKDLSLVMQKK